MLVRSGYLAFSQGAPDTARERLSNALELRREMRDRRGVGMVLAALGLVETVSGDYERAERPLAEARELFRRAGDRWGLVSSLWRTADLAIVRERLDQAEAALEEARTVAGATDREAWIAVRDDRDPGRGGAASRRWGTRPATGADHYLARERRGAA